MDSFENNLKKENSIGIFDSGVGGVGVLKELVNVLPHENFIYYGDSFHAPYGEKTPEQVFELCHNVVKHLLSQNVKTIIIACNTATSVSAYQLRQMYPEINIVGMEPALKQAIDPNKNNKVLVMATPVTLHLEKYKQLLERLEEQADYISVECPGLAKRIEQSNLDADDLKELLQNYLSKYKGKVDNVVLGCTHYPFVRKQIKEILGDIPLIDGGKGTALHVKHLLEEHNLLNTQNENGIIIYQSSNIAPEEIELYKELYDLYELSK